MGLTLQAYMPQRVYMQNTQTALCIVILVQHPENFTTARLIRGSQESGDRMIVHNKTKNKYFRDGVEITEAEYSDLLSEIREKAALVNQLYNGEITIDDVPDEWREEIQRRVDERLTEIDDDPDLTAEEALDIILGGGANA